MQHRNPTETAQAKQQVLPDSGPVAMVEALLREEREYTSLLWGVLHEQRLLDQMPEWAARMEAGRSADWEQSRLRRIQLEAVLEELIQGFTAEHKRPLSRPQWAAAL